MEKVWGARKGRTIAGSALVALGLTTATTGMVFAASSAAADDPSPTGEGLVEVADPDEAAEVEAVVSEKKDAEKKAPADDKGGNKSDDKQNAGPGGKKNDQPGEKKEDKPGKGGEKEDKGGKPDKSPGNPPGNNGTVKIAELGDLDEIPNNQPHQGCVFTVQWYNFDEGDDIISQVTFEAWAPTKVPMTVDGPSSVFVGEDPASGAGNDFDGEAIYTLDFDGEPHPQQGYHVKLTVNTPGSIGADKKSKVFWVEGCEDETPTPTPSETTSTSPSETATTSTTTPSETATTSTTSPSETATTSTTSPSETATTSTTSPSETATTTDTTTPTVNPSSSTAPPATNPGGKTPPGQQPGTKPTVKGVEAQAPAAVPTSVDAGLAPAEDDSGRNLAMMVLGMLLAVAGAVFGFTPAPTRGKFKH